MELWLHCGILGTAILAGILHSPAPAAAREIYVSPTGDDAARGTMQQPLQSIRLALTQAAAGDVIRLRAGEYRPGEIVLTRGGDADRPLTIEGMPGEQVTLKGSRLVTGWQKHTEGIWKLPNWQINSQQLFVDGTPLQQIGIHNRYHTDKLWADHVCLPPVGKGLADLKPGSFFYDPATLTLYCMLSDASDPNQHQMEASVDAAVLDGTRASFITLRNLAFLHSNITAKNLRQAVVRIGGKGWLIEDCQITFGDFGGLGISGEGHSVRRCRISNNGAVGIDMNGSDEAHKYSWYPERATMNILIEDVEFTGNNYRGFFDQWHAGGLKCVPCCRGVTIRRCRVVGNRGAGVWFDGGLGDIRIEDNLIADNITGIFYEISAPVPGDSFGALIRNNRVVRSRNQGIYISASSGAIVENNTCYQNRWDIVVHGMPRKDMKRQWKLENNRIRDNIVAGKLVGIAVFVGEGAGNNEVDGNFYADLPLAPDGKPPLKLSLTKGSYGASLVKDFKQAFVEYVMEGHGKSGDAGWLDADRLDFRLRPGSPAAGKGWQPPTDAR